MRTIHTVILALAVPALVVAGTATAGASDRAPKPYTFAVFGDIPYGQTAIDAFPRHIGEINADPDAQFVVHLGDIKNGSGVCSNEYFALIKSDFDLFSDPLIYTPGDNEWTDCHRTNNGAYNPLERLAKVRSVFFPQPGVTLGQNPVKVDSQARRGFPENVSWSRSGVDFAAVHIVGSNNSLAPWTGNTAPTAEQQAEFDARNANGVTLVKQTFDEAREDKSKAVVIMIQADMFDPTVPIPAPADARGFTTFVQTVAAESRRFNGPVYLMNGDSHGYTVDNPLGAGSPWLALYGVTTPVPNLTRITVDGSNNANDWLKVTIDRSNPAVLSWKQVYYTS